VKRCASSHQIAPGVLDAPVPCASTSAGCPELLQVPRHAIDIQEAVRLPLLEGFRARDTAWPASARRVGKRR